MINNAFVINLKKRKDRLQKFMKNNHNLHNINIHIFEAIDLHNSIVNNNKTIYNNHQFDNRFINKFKGKIGEVGCFLSHYLLWKECIDRNEEILIFEDDCIVFDNFHILNSVLKKENVPNDTEIIWVGTYQPSKQHRDIYPKIIDFTKHFHKICLDYKQSIYTYCYIIYPKTAYKLCKIIEETSCMQYNAVDHFLCTYTGNNNNHVIFTNNTSDIRNTFICTAYQGDSDVQNTPVISQIYEKTDKDKNKEKEEEKDEDEDVNKDKNN